MTANVQLEDDREASIQGGDVGGIRVCTVAMGRHHIRNDVRNRNRHHALKLVFQEQGECRFEQAGRALLLRPGQWCAYDKNRPFYIQASDFSRQTAVVLQRPSTCSVEPGCQPMWSGSFLEGSGSVLHASATAAVAGIGGFAANHSARLGEIMAALLELTLASEQEESDAPSPDWRRTAALNYIDRNLSDPALDLDAVARALCCSKRTLHKLFAGRGTTVGRLIWERRLERCRDELLDQARARRTLTDIALGWGFSDSQHFSRAFKTRFGVTPSDFRARRCVC